MEFYQQNKLRDPNSIFYVLKIDINPLFFLPNFLVFTYYRLIDMT